MSSVPFFSGEISVFEDPEDGLKIECSEKHVSILSADLNDAGFSCGPSTVAVHGTKTIHNYVAFPVTGGTFDALTLNVAEHLEKAGVTVHKESFHSGPDKHDRYNLTNVSVFDK